MIITYYREELAEREGFTPRSLRLIDFCAALIGELTGAFDVATAWRSFGRDADVAGELSSMLYRSILCLGAIGRVAGGRRNDPSPTERGFEISQALMAQYIWRDNDA
jgi:hypothetical protein